ncbi:hypothetical protein AX767_00800 [Variovorax sp. PAMC 28711]|nr:hypothetical protein AX767_00800 [Variovorax sp. PAMC 28711]
MKKITVCLLLVLAAPSLWAQSLAATGNADFAVERARLTAERAAVDKAFTDERAVCFKKFSVEDCLAKSRQQRRTALDNIKRQEALINDAERKRRGGAALDRLEEKDSAQRAQEAATQRDKAAKAQQDREQRSTDHTAGRAATAAQEGAMQRQYDGKQRAHAEQLAKEASRRAAAPAEVRRQEEKLKKAQAHRADVEKKNAERTKPRSAPLPAPPP